MNATVTPQEFVDAVNAVLEKRGPDYIYEGPETACVYSEDGGVTGSCLFGAALIDELHVPYNKFWEGSRISAILPDVLLDGVPSVLRCAAIDAQIVQDSGKPYREVAETWERITSGF